MRQFKDYMPALAEKKGKLYFPKMAIISGAMSLIIFVGLVSWAVSYPYQKAREVLGTLQSYAAMIDLSKQDTQTVIRSLEAIQAANPNNTKLVNDIEIGLYAIKEQLNVIEPINEARILELSEEQAKSYLEAQSIIENSPFKGLDLAYVPQTQEGKNYLNALKVSPPKPFEYQKLTDGIPLALAMYRGARQVQNDAEKLLQQANQRLQPQQNRTNRRGNNWETSDEYMPVTSPVISIERINPFTEAERNVTSSLQQAAITGEEKHLAALEAEKERLARLKEEAAERRKLCNSSASHKAICEEQGVDLRTGYFKEGMPEVILRFPEPQEATPAPVQQQTQRTNPQQQQQNRPAPTPTRQQPTRQTPSNVPTW